MPFDENEQKVFVALTRPLDTFRSALAVTIEQLREAHEADAREKGEATAAQGADLGSFAAGHIDLDQFEAMAKQGQVAVEPRAIARLDEAFHSLSELAAQKEQLFRVNVEPGASLHHAVNRAYKDVGRAYGAARVAEVARNGRYSADEHASWLEAYPFQRWNRTERLLTPPLVVRVDGQDVRAESLSEFIDGGAKIVLIVRGECAPAPLVRMITPGAYVAQVKDATELEAFAAFPGPGIAAVVPATSALFVHDPSRGDSISLRLHVESLPDVLPERSLGSFSVFQQTEPLRQLSALVSCGAAKVLAGDHEDDPAGKLAAWLLQQADLESMTPEDQE